MKLFYLMNETFKNENIILVFIITLSHVNKMTKYWSFNHVEKNLLFYDSFIISCEHST